MTRVVIGALLFLYAAAGQPRFEVASIRVNKGVSESMGGIGMSYRTGRASFRNYSLQSLIQVAYRLNQFQVLRAPAWFATERYDIEARAAGPCSYEDGQLMLQTLLAERFNLKVQPTTVEIQGFLLEVAKGGAKLVPAAEGSGMGFRKVGRSELEGPADMAMLARVLTSTLGAPVQDGTKLPGIYQIKLSWTADVAQEGGVPVVTAIQEQLGLVLKKTKVPSQGIVIESADRIPSEN